MPKRTASDATQSQGPDEPYDPVAEANRKVQSALDEIEATVQGLPQPNDPRWLEEQREAGLIPEFPEQSPRSGLALPSLLKEKSRIRRGKYGPTEASPGKKKMEQQLSEEHWYLVVEAYRSSGAPGVIAEETGLSVAQVNHIIKEGIWRLGLPSVREFMVNFAEVNKRLQGKNLPAVQEAPGLLDEHEIEAHKAITERVTREAATAQKALSMASLGSSLVIHYVQALVRSLEDGRTTLSIPDEVHLGTISKLAELVATASRAVTAGVKVSRLAAGEPTEILSAKIATLLEGLTLDELEEVERRGLLPYRVRAAIAGESSFKQDAIDVPYTETNEAGAEVHRQPTHIQEALEFQRQLEDLERPPPDIEEED